MSFGENERPTTPIPRVPSSELARQKRFGEDAGGKFRLDFHTLAKIQADFQRLLESGEVFPAAPSSAMHLVQRVAEDRNQPALLKHEETRKVADVTLRRFNRNG